MDENKKLDKFEQLIHDIIFGKEFKININIQDYIDDILFYEDFISKVTTILNQSGIDLHNEEVNLKKNDIIWSFIAKK